ncbi:uncharacterized protein RBU57_001206 [Macrochelys suwanniensis]
MQPGDPCHLPRLPPPELPGTSHPALPPPPPTAPEELTDAPQQPRPRPATCQLPQNPRDLPAHHLSLRSPNDPHAVNQPLQPSGDPSTAPLLPQQPGTPSTLLLSQPTRDPRTALQWLQPLNTPPHTSQLPREPCDTPQLPRDASPVLRRYPDTPPAPQQIQLSRDGSPVLLWYPDTPPAPQQTQMSREGSPVPPRHPDTPPAPQQSPPLRVDPPDPQRDTPAGETATSTTAPQGTDGDTVYLAYPLAADALICSVCSPPRRFRLLGGVTRHLKRYHGKSTAFSCAFCGLPLESQKRCKAHQASCKRAHTMATLAPTPRPAARPTAPAIQGSRATPPAATPRPTPAPEPADQGPTTEPTPPTAGNVDRAPTRWRPTTPTEVARKLSELRRLSVLPTPNQRDPTPRRAAWIEELQATASFTELDLLIDRLTRELSAEIAFKRTPNQETTRPAHRRPVLHRDTNNRGVGRRNTDPRYDPAAASRVQRLYRTNRLKAMREVLDGPPSYCTISPERLHNYFHGVFGGVPRNDAQRPDFTRFADWRFIHRARLNCLPLNGAVRHGNRDKRCRKCGYVAETLPHVLCSCKPHARAWQLRHNAVQDRLVKAINPRLGQVTVNRAVPGTDSQLRPDIVITDEVGKKIILVDVTIPFENRTPAFRAARARKLEKYAPLADTLRSKGYEVHTDAFLVGALGAWDPCNERVLRTCGVGRHYARLMRRLMVSDTIRWSRDIYTEHVAVNRAVPGTDSQLRPDIVITDEVGKKIILVDVTIPFENRTPAFRAARARKLEKYAPLADTLRSKGYEVHTDAFLVGALGAWDPCNERVLRTCGVGRHYARLMRRLMVSDTIRWSRDIYTEHVAVNRAVPGTDSQLRPDIVITDEVGKKIILVDVTIPFENRTPAFRAARARKLEKYAPLADTLRSKGYEVHTDAFLVGALGAWDPCNERVLRTCGVGRHYARLMRRLMVSDTIRWSRDIYTEHVAVNRAVPGTDSQLRPDIVITDEVGKKIILVDVTIPFENRTPAFRAARARKLEKYAPLADTLRSKGYEVHTDAFLVGALGAWDPCNERVLRTCGVGRHYARLMRRLMVSDTIRWSRDIYTEHVTGHRQYQV